MNSTQIDSVIHSNSILDNIRSALLYIPIEKYLGKKK